MFSFFNKKRNYFDYASATPIDPRVLKSMKPFLIDSYGNPSSPHKEGVVARRAIEDARKHVASVLQCKPDEIVFTAGGTESNNLAILGTFFHHKNVLKKEKIHFVTTSIEHSSVLQVFEHVRSLGAKVTYVSPEVNGIVSAKKIAEAVRPETVLVSVMYANNEIGTIMPVREISKLLPKEVLFHVDACQGASYLPLLMNDLGADLLTLDSSKFCGPKGTGILSVKSALSPVMFGGGQEKGLRPGTENVAGIVGFAHALMLAQKERVAESRRLRGMRDRLKAELQKKVKGLKVNGDLEKRLPNNINICVPGLDAEYAVLRLDALGFALSSVTSCKSLSGDPSSYVVEELYEDASCSRSSLRITMGRFTTDREVNALVTALLTVL